MKLRLDWGFDNLWDLWMILCFYWGSRVTRKLEVLFLISPISPAVKCITWPYDCSWKLIIIIISFQNIFTIYLLVMNNMLTSFTDRSITLYIDIIILSKWFMKTWYYQSNTNDDSQMCRNLISLYFELTLSSIKCQTYYRKYT